MRLTILNWFKESLISFLGKSIEILFRVILFILPLGVFLTLIQNRDKASTIRTISVYTTDESKWQHIYPGFILVAVDPNSFKKGINKVRSQVQKWLSDNRYILEFLFAASVVTLLILKEAH